MAIAKTIIDQVKSGMGPEELARKNSWKDLSGVNLDELLKTAVNMENKQQSYNLLVYLFRVSFDKDLWFSTEVLSQAVQHPIMTLLDHQAILPTMRSHLNKIKDQIASETPSEDKLVKYWLMEANYYAVNANMLTETGQKADAAQNYKIAQSIFEQLGLYQQASKYKVLSWRVQGDDIQKTPIPKTSPIKFRLPPTQPFNQPFSITSEPVNQKFDSQKPTTVLDPKKVEPTAEEPAPEEPALEEPVAEKSVAEEPALEEKQPGTADDKEAPVVKPAEEEPRAVESAAEIARPPKATTSENQAEEEQVAPAPSQGINSSSAFLAQDEGSPSSEYYYPLPDVWIKEGQLHVLGIDKFEGDEARRLKRQIEHESDILMGVQLLSQMYLVRRNVLEREVKKLERKAHALRQRIDRLERKTGRLENK